MSCESSRVKRRDFLERWGLSGLRISLGFLEGEFSPSDPDREAAWELYVELLTRVTTQPLPDDDGDEAAALASVHALFALTREILRSHRSGCGEFAKLAIPVLNQVIRPFTARWHRIARDGGLDDPDQCRAFRAELRALQSTLRRYTGALAELADVEDLTGLEVDRDDR